jgi:hypothetical protein
MNPKWAILSVILVSLVLVSGCCSGFCGFFGEDKSQKTFIGEAYLEKSVLYQHGDHLLDEHGNDFGYVSANNTGNPYLVYANGKPVTFIYVELNPAVCPSKAYWKEIVQIVSVGE